MEENNVDPLKQFVNIMKERHLNSKNKINIELHDEIEKTSELILQTEDDEKITYLLHSILNRFENENLNQVVDLFIYFQSYHSTNEIPLAHQSLICMTIGQLFTEKNLHYTASKIYDKDEIVSGCALSLLIYLSVQKQHTDYIMRFLKENFEGFSDNNKMDCVFKLHENNPENKIAQEIIQNSGITEYKLVFNSEVDSSSTPITFQLDQTENNLNSENSEETTKSEKTTEIKSQPEKIEENSKKKPWWKFW